MAFMNPFLNFARKRSTTVIWELSVKDAFSGKLNSQKFSIYGSNFSMKLEISGENFNFSIDKSDNRRIPILSLQLMCTTLRGKVVGIGMNKEWDFNEGRLVLKFNSLITLQSLTYEDYLKITLTLNTVQLEFPFPSFFIATKSESAEQYFNLSSNMKDLYLQEKNCDFTIRVKNEKFPVHKAILRARCPVLSAMMENSNKEDGTDSFEVTDSDPEVIKKFLLYLYTGQVEEDPESKCVFHLYTLGEKYNLPNLKMLCVDFLEKNMNYNLFFDGFRLAWNENLENLKSALRKLFLTMPKDIIENAEWALLMQENSAACNQLFLKYTTSHDFHIISDQNLPHFLCGNLMNPR